MTLIVIEARVGTLVVGMVQTVVTVLNAQAWVFCEGECLSSDGARRDRKVVQMMPIGVVAVVTINMGYDRRKPWWKWR